MSSPDTTITNPHPARHSTAAFSSGEKDKPNLDRAPSFASVQSEALANAQALKFKTLADFHVQIGIRDHLRTQGANQSQTAPAAANQSLEEMSRQPNLGGVDPKSLRLMLSLDIPKLPPANATDTLSNLLVNAAHMQPSRAITRHAVEGLWSGLHAAAAGENDQAAPPFMRYVEVVRSAHAMALQGPAPMNSQAAHEIFMEGVALLVTQFQPRNPADVQTLKQLIGDSLGIRAADMVDGVLANAAKPESPPKRETMATPSADLVAAAEGGITNQLELRFIRQQLRLGGFLSDGKDVRAEAIALASSTSVNEVAVRYLGSEMKNFLDQQPGQGAQVVPGAHWENFTEAKATTEGVKGERYKWLTEGLTPAFVAQDKASSAARGSASGGAGASPEDAGLDKRQVLTVPPHGGKAGGPSSPQKTTPPAPLSNRVVDTVHAQDISEYLRKGYTVTKSEKGASGSAVLESADGKDRYQLKTMAKFDPALRDIAKPMELIKQLGGVAKTAVKGVMEICAEFIASKLARAMLEARKQPNLVPDVELIRDDKNANFGLTSKYLSDCEGDLDAFFDHKFGRDPKTGMYSTAGASVVTEADTDRHVKVEFTSDGDVLLVRGVRKVSLGKDAAEDMVSHLLDSNELGDHDINPANFMVVRVNNVLRVARIDFGHAFNDLAKSARMDLKAMGGGGTGEGNRMVDFVNRPLLVGHDANKLWRDYRGLVPSELLVAVLKKRATHADAVKRAVAATLLAVQGDLLEMNAAWKDVPSADRKALRESLRTALTQLIDKIGGTPVPEGSTDRIYIDNLIPIAITNVLAFMNVVGNDEKEFLDRCQLQLKVDQSLRATPGEKADQPYREAEALFNRLAKGEPGKFQWLKVDDEDAFVGDLHKYSAKRSFVLKSSGSVKAGQ